MIGIDSVNRINDIKSIKSMIVNSMKASFLIVLPQNIDFKSNSDGRGGFIERKKLKDCIPEMMSIIGERS